MKENPLIVLLLYIIAFIAFALICMGLLFRSIDKIDKEYEMNLSQCKEIIVEYHMKEMK
jgi:hypothetical protein